MKHARAALIALGNRGRRWLSLAALLPLAGPWVLGWSLLTNLVMGMLPIGFILGTSVMIERLPLADSGRSATGMWTTVIFAFAVALGALIVQNALAPLQIALGELITRRIDGHCIQRLLTASMGSAPLDMLERPDVQDKLSDAYEGLVGQWQTPGSAGAGLLALVARYTQIVGAVGLVGVALNPLASIVLGATAAVVRVGSRSSLTRWSLFMQHALARPRRRMRYVLDTGSDTAIAKEARVLGILPWLRARAENENRAYLAPLWRERRRIYFAPFLVFTAVMLIAAIGVLLQLGDVAAAGDLSVLDLSLAVQAVLVPLRMGTFFPESDQQTLDGMLTYDTISRLERSFAVSASHRAASDVVTRGPQSVIRFEDVRFRYAYSDRYVLSGLDLDLPTGRSTAIVGLNGAGKTTLVKLLARLHEPTGGKITVDGIDLRDFDLKAWRQRLAVIFQDYIRYELDVAANIGFGAPARIGNATALHAALNWAKATELVSSLPAGIATPLSSQYPGGVDLSGGQWQRIALARAFFAVEAGASVLVLDEPTAQLDARAEVAFFDRFLELTRGLTTVIISHRFSTVRRADGIIVIANGRVAEAGEHAGLLRNGGQYAELFHLQAQRFTQEGRYWDAT